MDKSFELPPLPDPAGQTDKERGYVMRQYTASQMQAYALAAVKAEREACAKVCEEMAYALDNGGNPYLYDRKAIQIAAKLRARGKS